MEGFEEGKEKERKKIKFEPSADFPFPFSSTKSIMQTQPKFVKEIPCQHFFSRNKPF